MIDWRSSICSAVPQEPFRFVALRKSTSVVPWRRVWYYRMPILWYYSFGGVIGAMFSESFAHYAKPLCKCPKEIRYHSSAPSYHWKRPYHSFCSLFVMYSESHKAALQIFPPLGLWKVTFSASCRWPNGLTTFYSNVNRARNIFAASIFEVQ